MPIDHKNNNGTTNGTTAVDIVPVPVSGRRNIIPVQGVSVKNTDDINHDVILQLDDNGTTRKIEQGTITPNQSFINSSVINLETTNQKLQVVLGEAISTSDPDYVSSYMEKS